MSDNDITPPSDSILEAEPDTPFSSAIMVGPSWQEQDAVLRDLWIKNKTPQEISALLGRSTAAIMTRAARLGLPRRSAPGRKPGSRRPPPSGEVRVSKPRPATNRTQEGESAPQPSPRICLMCLRSFQSQGRHNRICPSCKNSAEYDAAVSLSEINFPV